jgi:hypothetical protein
MTMPPPLAFVIGAGLALVCSVILRKLTKDAYQLARSRARRPSLPDDPVSSRSKEAA